MDFEPFAFHINEDALPELTEGYRFESRKVGRPHKDRFDPGRDITEQQHRLALEGIFDSCEEYGYKELQEALIVHYPEIGVRLSWQKSVALIAFLRSRRMVVQEYGRKYRINPDYH